MISVVMATYNGEQYLGEQLASICNQTRRPDEIIICDDHSSDSTADIVQNVGKQMEIPIMFTVNQERMGYARNFRKALTLAKGDIIFFSDQDDIWEENKIEMCEQFFEKNPSALALSTAYSLIDEKGNLKKENILYCLFTWKKMKKVKWESFIRHPKYPGMAMAVRRELLLQVERIKEAEEIPHDWLLNHEAAYYGRMYFFPVVLTRYRIHGGNTVGISVNRKEKSVTDKRETMINDMERALHVMERYHTDKQEYLRNARIFQGKRKQLYRENQIGKLFLYDFFHLNYISFRSLLGDCYMSVTRRTQ